MMSPHYTRINILKIIGLTTYLQNPDIFKVVHTGLDKFTSAPDRARKIKVNVPI